MQSRQFGSLRAQVVGGTDGKGGGNGPVIVLLHGFGAPGTDLVPLHQVFRVAEDVRWVFPEAPLDLGALGFGPGARAWWMIDMAALEHAQRTGEVRDRSQDIPEGLAPVREAMTKLLDAVEKELTPSKLVLGGFSQGAMVSMDVALRDERPLAGLIQLSGTLLAESEWKPRMAARAGLPVLQSHGRQDPLLPFAIAQQLETLMNEAGMENTFVGFDGGHDIPRVTLEEMQRFFDRVLAS
jgi:phospholipase/carboxylesterase